jgi:flagellar hook-associated protein 3 FlgL
VTLIRTTQSTMTENSLAGLQAALARTQKNQSELATGKTVLKPSDNPAAASDILRYSSDLTRNDQLQKNVSDAQAWLGTTDSTLSSIITAVQQVRDLTLQAVNASADQTARNAIATQIAQIKTQIIGLANTKYGDQLIFAGSANVTNAFDNTGAFQGNTDTMQRTIGPNGETLQVNMDGQTVFGTGATQLFTVLQSIVDNLNTGSTTTVGNITSTDLANLDSAKQQLQISLSTVGARANRADSSLSRLTGLAGSTKSQMSQVQDTDMAQTIMDLQANQSAYQAALAATSKVIQPSLMDFLRP